MSGHSHWSSIKHKKGATDAKRGKLFSKLAKNIMTAARHGGRDLDSNLTLKYAVDKAKAANMTKDSIERAIKKGTGELAGEELFEITYEGYGPGGVAMMIETLTDNKNRTAAEVRKALESRGGSLGSQNCVAFRFEKKGVIIVSADQIDEDSLMEIVLDAGAEDLENVSDIYQITTAVSDFEGVKAALTEKEIEMVSAEISQVANDSVPLDEARGKKILDLMETLDESEDVQNVYANFELPESLLQAEA